MPKRVDHLARRRQIAAAIWMIAAVQGLGAVSLREVASEAGVSMGMVQHYFTTKEQMLLFACETMVELAREDLHGLLATIPAPQSARGRIRSLCLHGLPLDASRRVGAAAWLAFVAGAAASPPLAAFIRRAWEDIHALVAAQLSAAQDEGRLAHPIDPNDEATALLALANGFLVHLLVGHRSGDEAIAAVERQLDRLFDTGKSG